MSLVNILNVSVLNYPAPFLAPLVFELEVECLQELEDDLEWKVIWVGSAEDTTRDQVLEEVMVGPVPVGVSKFQLEAPPPNPSMIPAVSVEGDMCQCFHMLSALSRSINFFTRSTTYTSVSFVSFFSQENLKGITVMLITCSYMDREFVRIGYYVNSMMPGDEEAIENGESGVDAEPTQMTRNILTDKPRVTKVGLVLLLQHSHLDGLAS